MGWIPDHFGNYVDAGVGGSVQAVSSANHRQGT